MLVEDLLGILSPIASVMDLRASGPNVSELRLATSSREFYVEVRYVQCIV
jgi:hypothetical protein